MVVPCLRQWYLRPSNALMIESFHALQAGRFFHRLNSVVLQSRKVETNGQRSRLLCYSVALLSVALVTFLRVPLAPFLGNSVPFILYFPAIMVAGWFGGMGPGFLATAVSGYCAKTWFFEPYGS